MREPGLHFLAIGGLIFLLFAFVDDSRETPADVIVVTPERIDQLAAGFGSVWKRKPTADELDALIDEYIREEVYYREALALGLDRNDAMVRGRLRQKMEFLSDTGAGALKPAAGELEAYLRANEQSFRRGPRLAFEQLYFGETANPESVTRSLHALQSGAVSDLSAIGQRSFLPARLALSPPTAIDGVFGKGFFTRIAKLPTGGWSGPVRSAFGLHVVRILENQPARTPLLEEIREAVLRDWRAAKARQSLERHYARLRQRYVVEIRGADGQLLETR